MDAEGYRRASLDQWERSARGWGARRERTQRAAAEVSTWMIEATAPQPGQTILELAAGPGETGLLAAELVRPGGRLISSDFAEPMLDVARARAGELGLDNVEFRALNAESLDLEAASVDAILCRWGYMLMADPAAALRESRRVLRPGGRLALAAWDAAERNPWASIAQEVVRRRLDAPPPAPEQPGMFAFALDGRIERLLEEAGFTGTTLDRIDTPFDYASFEDWWEVTLDLSRPFSDYVATLDPAATRDLQRSLREAFEPFESDDGSLCFPGRCLVAAAFA